MVLLKKNILAFFLLIVYSTIFAYSSSDILFQPSGIHNHLSEQYFIAANVKRPVKPNKRRKTSPSTLKREVADHLAKKITSYHWRRKERKKIINEVLEYRGSTDNNIIFKEGLIAHEGGENKGHTILRHVSISKKTLHKRIEFLKTDKKSGKKDHNRLNMPAISSFKNLPKAEKFIDKSLRRKEIQTKIKAWANKNGKKIAFKLKDLGEVTGLAFDPVSKKLLEVRGITIVLKRDKNNRRGWSIISAYPSQ